MDSRRKCLCFAGGIAVCAAVLIVVVIIALAAGWGAGARSTSALAASVASAASARVIGGSERAPVPASAPAPAPAPAPTPTSAPTSPEIVWPDSPRCYPRALVADCLRAAQPTSFSFPDEQSRKRLESDAARLSTEYGINVNSSMLTKMWVMEAAIGARNSGARAQRFGDRLAAASRNHNVPILELSARYKLPPISVLRQVLIESGHDAAAVRQMISNPNTLPPQLASQANDIFEADLGSRINSERIRASSREYEKSLEQYLRSAGVSFKTEDDLKREALQPTPDILFDSPVRIGKHLVAWMDAKDYPAVDSRLVAASLKKQAAKYTKKFGPGAFVFSGGLMCDSKSAKLGALLLDGSHLNALIPPAPSPSPAPHPQ